MLIAKLTISYDRGVEYNRPKDLLDGLKKAEDVEVKQRGETTKDGKIIRGIGTHFKSKEALELYKLRGREASRIRGEFRKRFLMSPLDGVYIIPSPGIGRRFIHDLKYRNDMSVTVTEFNLESTTSLDDAQLSEWAARVKNQFKNISLGRTPEADEDGLRALDALSKCPCLSKATGTRIRELVAMVREHKLTRIEVRRALEKMPVEIEQEPLAPHRSAMLMPHRATLAKGA